VHAQQRGSYKIFLGMAAGAGKTYRMLQEGRAEVEAGRDVVLGYLEPHDRPETIALSRGLELVPRRRVSYRDTLVPEMDLPAVLRREAELCLIDELAHTNPPGLDHEKRYQDIEDVLASGTDVFSTVNVQHLESLNDQVAELTGVRVRETFPDSVLSAADEVVLVDLTPQALIQRLRDGKVYPAERVETALNNFFKVENLAALREVALRQVAENVESQRIVQEHVSTREERVAGSAPQAVGERLMALVTSQPSSQRLVRRAWRSAQRLGADLDLLFVTGGHVDENEIRALRKLASVLGAHLLVESGDQVAEVVERVARQRGTTYILLGRGAAPAGLVGRLREPLVLQLLRRLPGVDVRVVADRAIRRGEEDETS
jgi:two-component system, OmpR family, sensor histidine kinase KdpD